MFDYIIKDKCQCSKDEKTNCFETIGLILELSDGARSFGLTFLENEVQKHDNFLLKTGISLILDGREPELVGRILKNYIISSESEGGELLDKIIIREGVLQLQQGSTSNIILESLVSILGEEMKEPADRYFNIYNDQINKSQQSIYKYLAEVKNKPNIVEEQLVLKKLIFGGTSIHKLSCTANLHTLAYTLRGISGNLQCRILQMMTVEKAIRIVGIMKDIDINDPEFSQKSIQSQNSIINNIIQLERSGEIINIELPIFRDMLKNYLKGIDDLLL